MRPRPVGARGVVQAAASGIAARVPAFGGAPRARRLARAWREIRAAERALVLAARRGPSRGDVFVLYTGDITKAEDIRGEQHHVGRARPGRGTDGSRIRSTSGGDASHQIELTTAVVKRR